jgi:hypothetical protein
MVEASHGAVGFGKSSRLELDFNLSFRFMSPKSRGKSSFGTVALSEGDSGFLQTYDGKSAFSKGYESSSEGRGK